jgi:hypothetical protein
MLGILGKLVARCLHNGLVCIAEEHGYRIGCVSVSQVVLLTVWRSGKKCQPLTNYRRLVLGHSN